MGINFNLAKKFAFDNILKQGLAYLEKNPTENLEKILDIAEKLLIRQEQKQAIRTIREKHHKDSLISQFVFALCNVATSNKNGLLLNFFVNASILGIPYQYKLSEKYGFAVPWTILIDPTSACNLNCEGCWAGKYNKTDSLSFETLDRIISEAKNLGIYFFIFSGGEPTLYPHLFAICQKHKDCGFMMYTNGTLIDEKMANQLLAIGNLTPAFSLEGGAVATDLRRGKGSYQRITTAMKLLRERKLIFGISLTAHRHNVEEISSHQFIDDMIEKGAMYSWIFHYIPIGKDPNFDLMLTVPQRKKLAYQVNELRSSKPIFLIDFWNDGTYSNGCIAGGRRYFHINAQGEAEPCAFTHFSSINVKNHSLEEVLQNPLFNSFQKRQPFHQNLMCPCPIIDNPQELKAMVAEAQALPTHKEAEAIFNSDASQYLNQLAQNWHKASAELFAERMKLIHSNKI